MQSIFKLIQNSFSMTDSLLLTMIIGPRGFKTFCDVKNNHNTS